MVGAYDNTVAVCLRAATITPENVFLMLFTNMLKMVYVPVIDVVSLSHTHTYIHTHTHTQLMTTVFPSGLRPLTARWTRMQTKMKRTRRRRSQTTSVPVLLM